MSPRKKRPPRFGKGYIGNVFQVGDLVQTRSGERSLASKTGKILRVDGDLAAVEFDGAVLTIRLQELETVEAVGVMDAILKAGKTELRQKVRIVRGGGQVTDYQKFSRFVELWQTSTTFTEAVEKLGMDRRDASNIAGHLRRCGVGLKVFVKSGKHGGRISKLCKDEWEKLKIDAGIWAGVYETQRKRERRLS